jgi:hypothetical protein
MSSGSKSTDNFIYYDASITNTSATESKEARFSSIGSELVLSNPSDYATSVIRFTIPTDNIPLLDPLSVIATGDLTSGSAVMTNVREFLYGSTASSISFGWLVEGEVGIPKNTSILDVKTLADGSISLTLNQASTVTQTDVQFTASGYVIAMRHSATGLFVSVPFTTNNEVLSYATHIENLNGALEGCFGDLKALDVGSDIVALDAPFFVLSTDSSKLNLYGEQGIWGGDSARAENVVSNIELYVNTALYNLLRGIPASIVDPTVVELPSFCNYTLLIEDTSSSYHGISSHLGPYPTITPTGRPSEVIITSGSPTVSVLQMNSTYTFWVGQSVTGIGIPGGTTIISVTDFFTFTMSNNATVSNDHGLLRWFSIPYEGYTVSQTSTSLPLWSPVQRLVFTTSMPVSTQITQKLAVETSLLLGSTSTEYRPVLIDFEPIFGVDDFTPYQYFPQGPWRFNDLIGSTDLRTVDIQVYWIDKRGQYNLVLIPPNDKCTILLAFVKKPFIQF